MITTWCDFPLTVDEHRGSMLGTLKYCYICIHLHVYNIDGVH